MTVVDSAACASDFCAGELSGSDDVCADTERRTDLPIVMPLSTLDNFCNPILTHSSEGESVTHQPKLTDPIRTHSSQNCPNQMRLPTTDPLSCADVTTDRSPVQTDSPLISTSFLTENNAECDAQTGISQVMPANRVIKITEEDTLYHNPYLAAKKTTADTSHGRLASQFSLFHSSLQQSNFLIKIALSKSSTSIDIYPREAVEANNGNTWRIKGRDKLIVNIKDLIGSRDLFQFELFMADAALLCPWGHFCDIGQMAENGNTDFDDAKRVKESYLRLLYVVHTLQSIYFSDTLQTDLRVSLSGVPGLFLLIARVRQRLKEVSAVFGSSFLRFCNSVVHHFDPVDSTVQVLTSVGNVG